MRKNVLHTGINADLGDLDQYPQLTKEKVVEDAECYEEAEAAAVEEVKQNPTIFQCDYCKGTFKALKGLKEHLFGVVREGNDKNRYRVVSCPQSDRVRQIEMSGKVA
uniref:C2H2-type domain-containing protein n=1 Tax=Tetranychus urticae TaxID=32264 RepID=T1KDM0_TETUR